MGDMFSPHPTEPKSDESSLTARTNMLSKRNIFHYIHFNVVSLCVFLCVVVLCLPSPYVVEMPGPTANVLAKVDDSSTNDGLPMISIKGAKTYKSSGQLRLVTISATGVPGYPTPIATAVWAWFSNAATATPQEVVYTVDETSQDYNDEGTEEMTTAQSSAKNRALAFLQKKGYDVSGIKITMNVGDVGGPSAGMMYTLGTIAKLTKVDETGGKIIAGTGTMEKDGTVGAIGGIQLKMIAAKRDGATWFIAPSSNCDEVVGHIPDGLNVVKVSNLNQAYSALVAIGKGKGATLATCSTQ